MPDVACGILVMVIEQLPNMTRKIDDPESGPDVPRYPTRWIR